MKMSIYLKLGLLILTTAGCINTKLSTFYVDNLDDKDKNKNKKFLSLNLDDSSFTMGLRSLGGIDTIHGYFEQQGNKVHLKRFYTRVSVVEYTCPQDSICIQFFVEGDDQPLISNISVNLNGFDYYTSDSGMIQISKSALTSPHIYISESWFLSAGQFTITKGPYLHKVWLAYKGSYMQEAFVFKVKRNRLKFETGAVFYSAEQ